MCASSNGSTQYIAARSINTAAPRVNTPTQTIAQQLESNP